jgi:hypothetical protein
VADLVSEAGEVGFGWPAAAGGEVGKEREERARVRVRVRMIP